MEKKCIRRAPTSSLRGLCRIPRSIKNHRGELVCNLQTISLSELHTANGLVRNCESLELNPETSLPNSATCVEVLFLLSNGMVVVIPYSQTIRNPPVHSVGNISTLGATKMPSHQLSFFRGPLSLQGYQRNIGRSA